MERVISWRASSSRGLSGLLSVACSLISSPRGLAWPRKLISATCNTPHPLCWPVHPPTLTAACSPNTNTQAPPWPWPGPVAPTRCIRAYTLACCIKSLPCHVRGRSGAYTRVLVSVISDLPHTRHRMFTFTHTRPCADRAAVMYEAALDMCPCYPVLAEACDACRGEMGQRKTEVFCHNL